MKKQGLDVNSNTKSQLHSINSIKGSRKQCYTFKLNFSTEVPAPRFKSMSTRKNQKYFNQPVQCFSNNGIALFPKVYQGLSTTNNFQGMSTYT